VNGNCQRRKDVASDKRASGAETHYSVGKKPGANVVFRNVKTGQFVSRVMSKDVYKKASASANTVIREYVTKKR
jgi:hypothetical protein